MGHFFLHFVLMSSWMTCCFLDLSPKLIYYKNLGVAAEVSSSVVVHSGYSYIPFIHKLPKPTQFLQSIDKCPHLSSLNTSARRIDEMMKRSIPEYNHLTSSNITRSNRQKRFLGIVLGGIGAGMSVWNRISISKLSDNLDTVRNFVSQNRKAVDDLITHDTKLISNQNIIHLSVVRLSEAMDVIRRDQICQSIEQDKFNNLLINYGLVAPSTFIRAVDFALQGRISPDLLPLLSIKRLIDNHPNLKETIYEQIPTLTYELGGVFVDVVNRDPIFISGVFVLPHILKGSNSILGTIGTVSLEKNGVLSKLALPYKAAFCDEKKIVWELNPLDCQISPSILSCPSSTLHRGINTCLTNIFYLNNTKNCSHIIRKTQIDDGPDVFQFQSGILISNDISKIKLVKLSGGRQVVVSPQLTDNSKSTFLTSSDADHVLIGEEIYPLILSVEDYNMIIYHDLDLEIPKLDGFDLSALSSKWTDIDELMPLPLIHESPATVMHVLLITVGIIIIITILIYIVYVFRKRNLKNNQKVEFLARLMGYKTPPKNGDFQS